MCATRFPQPWQANVSSGVPDLIFNFRLAMDEKGDI